MEAFNNNTRQSRKKLHEAIDESNGQKKQKREKKAHSKSNGEAAWPEKMSERDAATKNYLNTFCVLLL